MAKLGDTKSIFRNQRHNNEISETEIRKRISFAIATRKIKCLGINLTKDVKGLYSEHYTTLKKDIKEDTNMEAYTMFMD